MDHQSFSTTTGHESMRYDMGHYPAQQQSPTQPFGVTQPVPIPPKSAHANTFVHKLYNMVVDTQFQHLIAWNYTGASFIVCNIMEFARDVLPKHFKHNNFSSFVRQLNMYGFHKVNKSPRGHRTLAENQIWEFSHPKFLRDRPDLLDDIKRKTMESDTVRRETGDLHAHLAMMQVSQSDMLQQINHLYDTFSQIVKELHDTKEKQQSHVKLVKQIMHYITQQNGGHLPQDLHTEFKKLELDTTSPPSIFVTTHDQQPSFFENQPLVPSQRPRRNMNNLMPLSSSSSSSSSTFRATPSSPTMLLSSSDEENHSSYYSTTNTPSGQTLSTDSATRPFSFINNNNSNMNG